MTYAHLFKVGDSVYLRAAARRAFDSVQTFKILARLPSDGRAREYLIRSNDEPHERVVTEGCLAKLGS
jgi:hypothetical protein